MAQVWGWKPERASQRARSWAPRGLAWLFALAEAGAPAGRESARDTEPAATRPNPTGDYDAFVREHEQAILNYLWRLTGNEQSAYDLTQETFLRAWRRFDQVRGYEDPRGWLFRVATNLGLTALSRRKTQASDAALFAPREQRLVTTPLGWTRTASHYIVATPVPKPVEPHGGQPMDTYTISLYDTSTFAVQ